MFVFSYKKFFVLFAIVLLSGCDLYNAVSADFSAAKYKNTCYGSRTYECESLLVDANVDSIEYYKSQFENGKGEFVSVNGMDAYDYVIDIFDMMISRQEAQRPGIFLRLFFADSQSSVPKNNWLFSERDIFQKIKSEVEKYQVSKAVKSNNEKAELKNLPFVGVRIFSFTDGNAYEMSIKISQDGETIINGCGRETCSEVYRGEFKDLIITDIENYHVKSNYIYLVESDGSPVYGCDSVDSENRCVSELIEQ
ncbi:hypothetical protein ACOI2Q_18370 [Shewanella algae]|uniref:hypothetical protein n=1 Tax=Shewanella algae TaxID=38313 RepID=UPI003B68498C